MTPTPFPYVFTTPVADLLSTVADPTTGVPSLFTADFGSLVALLIGIMWLALFVRRYVTRRV